MPTEPFDVAFVTSRFGVCNLLHYLNIIRAMSDCELRALKSEVKAHQRIAEPQQAFADTPRLSTHQAILKAISHERLRRSIWFKPWSLLLPIRRFFVSRFSGMDLQFNEHFGTLYVVRPSRTTFLHISFRELASMVGAFLANNWFSVASLVVAIAAVVVAWLRP